jgi:hypothetical protein
LVAKNADASEVFLPPIAEAIAFSGELEQQVSFSSVVCGKG